MKNHEIIRAWEKLIFDAEIDISVDVIEDQDEPPYILFQSTEEHLLFNFAVLVKANVENNVQLEFIDKNKFKMKKKIFPDVFSFRIKPNFIIKKGITKPKPITKENVKRNVYKKKRISVAETDPKKVIENFCNKNKISVKENQTYGFVFYCQNQRTKLNLLAEIRKFGYEYSSLGSGKISTRFA